MSDDKFWEEALLIDRLLCAKELGWEIQPNYTQHKWVAFPNEKIVNKYNIKNKKSLIIKTKLHDILIYIEGFDDALFIIENSKNLEDSKIKNEND